MKTQESLALQFVGSFTTGDSEILNEFHEDYKMHRPEYPSTMETMASFFPGQPYGMKTENVRYFVDGDIVVTHNYTSEYPGSSPFISIDILRFKDGKIADYWDNMEVESETSESSNSQYDGATLVEDFEKTKSNKSLITAHTQNILIDGKIERLEEYVNQTHLDQHAVGVENGFKAYESYLLSRDYNVVTLKKVLGQGNFVLAICDGMLDKQAATFYNMYRIKNDKIVEHWEVTEVNAPKDKWANTNGRTNFSHV